MSELQKIADQASRAVIENRIIEAVCFDEFRQWMGEVPAWFDLAKCWEEETGEQVARELEVQK